jgi:hypothetical protein
VFVDAERRLYLPLRFEPSVCMCVDYGRGGLTVGAVVTRPGASVHVEVLDEEAGITSGLHSVRVLLYVGVRCGTCFNMPVSLGDLHTQEAR